MSSQKPSGTESELEPFYMLNINEETHPISTLAASVVPQSEKEKEPEKKGGGLAHWSFSDLMPSRVPIVKVRPDQLKEIKSGKEKALAYQSSRRGFFGSFFGKPVDFKEPELPQGAIDNPEFGLLPPKPD